MLFDRLDDLFESLGAILGELGEDLSVEGDICLFKHRDELGVGEAVFFEKSRHTDVPKASEVAFLVPPVSESVRAGVEDRFVRLALLSAPAVAVAFDLR